MVKLVFTLRRLDSLTREEFSRYWREEHAPLAQRHAATLRIRRCVQTRAIDTGLDEAVAASRGSEPRFYDGVAELWWDSTRSSYDGFSLDIGAASATNWEDDVFPSAVRVSLGLSQEGRSASDANVLGDVPGNVRSIRISNSELFNEIDEGGPRFLRVGDEWMEVQEATGFDLRVRRGARSTDASTHDAGAPVIVGRSFERTISIPANRSWFRGPGEGN